MTVCTLTDFYSNVYAPVGQFIDLTLNYILLATALVGFYFFWSYFRPLINLQRTVLKPLGIGMRHCLWMLVVCFKRHKTFGRIRLFVEASIIATKGECRNRAWWNGHCRAFSRGLSKYLGAIEADGGEGAELVVGNCFDLTSEDFSGAVQRYFEALGQARFRRFMASHASDEEVSFLLPVRILDGYLAPMSFISGLAQRFDHNWEKILVNYYATLEAAGRENYGPGEQVLPEELFFSYNWLMWGPSYRVSMQDASPKRHLILYGYGDEANSINVIVGGGDPVWQQLREQHQGPRRCFGMHGPITGRLVGTDRYANRHAAEIDEGSYPFFSRMSQPSLGIPFALELQKFKPVAEAGDYFFSAYIWIMFTLERRDAGHTFYPERSVTFFEHANIANNDNYRFLTECLMEKVFRHFGEYAALPAGDPARERRYRYCISMNGDIEQAFFDRLAVETASGDRAAWFRTHLVDDPASRFGISTVLNAFDNYFMPVKIRELDYNENADRLRLGHFHVNTYFPQCGAAAAGQSLDHILRKLQARADRDAAIRYHLLAATDESGEIAGLISFYYMTAGFAPESHAGGAIIEDVVVKTEGKGVRKRLMQEALDCIWQEAAWDGRLSPRFVLFRALAYCAGGAEAQNLAKRWARENFRPLNDRPDNIWLVNDQLDPVPGLEEVAAGYEAHQDKLYGKSKSAVSGTKSPA